MAKIVFDPRTGKFEVTAAEKQEIDQTLRRIFRSGNKREHEVLGEVLLGPIRAISEYEEWTKYFFVPRQIQPGDIVRVVKPSYVATAWFTSPYGEPNFVRPGRLFGTVSWFMVDAGLELHWDDMEMRGYESFEQHARDVGGEMARKRDAVAGALLDAAINAQTGHVVTVGGAMTKSAVDAVIRAAADGPFKLAYAVVNSARVMDMTDWSWSVTTPLWAQIQRGEEIMQNGYVGNYGGLNWYVHKSVDRSKVYFGTAPQNIGWHLQMGGTRTASDSNIMKRVDYHVWDEKHSYTVECAVGLYRIDIT